MKLRPGLEIQGRCCGGWHVLFQPEGWESDTTASRNFLYWRCAQNGSKGAYYAGASGRSLTATRCARPEADEMLNEFLDASNPPLPVFEHSAYRQVVREAIDLLRPAAEGWAVMVAKEAAMTRFDFSRDTDAPRSLTVATDGDDDERSKTFAMVCHFLLAHWPSIEQRPS